MANTNECKSCGYVMNNRQMKCPYCGSGNPGYDNKLQQSPYVSSVRSSFQNNAQPPIAKAKRKFSVGLFILLLIICWPGAIVYLVISTK